MVGSAASCCHTSLLGELSTICMIPLGEDSWTLVPHCSWVLTYVSFSIPVFSPFAIVDYNHKLTAFLNSMSPSRKLIESESGLEDSQPRLSFHVFSLSCY